MLRYLKPIGVFLSGMGTMLLVLLFMPALGTAKDSLATLEGTENFWGWGFAVGGVRLIIVALIIIFTLVATFVSFLQEHNRTY